MARISCPWPDFPEAWIDIPDQWLGVHIQRRDKAARAAEKYDSVSITNFAAALSLLDDWNLPGLNGNIENWDFTKLDLRLINWVQEATLISFLACFEVPKNSSPPSVSG